MKKGILNSLLIVVKYFLVYLWVLIIIVPIVNIVLSGFKTPTEVTRIVSFPSGLYLGNYKEVFSSSAALLSFLNSAVISFFALMLDIVLSSLAAYAIARRKEKIFEILYIVFLSAMMIPAVANLASIYSIIFRMGLKDTRTALVLIYSSTQIPMGILLYTSFIKTLPRQLDEAATIDGCGYLKRFFVVIFPLLKPVSIAFAVTALVYIWNDFLMPLMILSSASKKTITLAVYSFVNEHQADFGAIYAMLIIALIPPILLFLFTQKYFYQGITAGAVKG
jgi:raffinose/stachyose/melibiose transport system permease protein